MYVTEVLIPSNFKEYEYETGSSEMLESLGFNKGTKIVTTRRVSVMWNTDAGEECRTDVSEGTVAFIVGYETKGKKPICEFKITYFGVEHTVGYAMKTSNITLAEAKEGVPAAAAHANKQGPAEKLFGKKFAFLDKLETKKDVKTVEKWSNLQAESDKKFQSLMLQWDIGFVLSRVMKLMPSYNEADLCIVKRDGAFEVWTLKAFKAGALMFVGATSEIKSAFWTQGRAALVSNSADLNPEGGKAFVLDGRLKASPEDGNRSFSLYWLVQKANEAADANMALHVSDATLDFKVTLPMKRKSSVSVDKASMPQIPIMYNPLDVGARVRLQVCEDKSLKTIADNSVGDAMRDKLAAAAAEATAKAKAKAVADSGTGAMAVKKRRIDEKQKEGEEKAGGLGAAKAPDGTDLD